MKGIVKQSQVIKWFQEYDTSTELNIFDVELCDDWEKCYSSQLPRAVLTAEKIYGANFHSSSGFNEPSISPIFAYDIRLPFLLWGLLFRIAILFNHKTQLHKKDVLERRIMIEVEKILSNNEKKVLIISHAFIMNMISKLLIKKGFKGEKIGHPEHAKLYVFERPD